jgi:hypothetical protein
MAAGVIAVFRHRARAEQVQAELEGLGLRGIRIHLEDRRLTDDEPEEPLAPAVEGAGGERSRDKEVTGHVFKTAVGLSALYGLAGFVLAAVIGGLAAGWGSTGFWIAVAVGTVTGSVLGAIQGGIGAAMTEAEKEEGTLLIVEAPNGDAARAAEAELRRHDPERVELTEA